MDHCARCGHTLGVGRYCVNCGQPRDQTPDDWRASTAERPAVPGAPDAADPGLAPPTELSQPTQSPWGAPAAPPPVYETPQQPRYPMYADEPVAPVTSVSQPAVWDAPSGGGSHRERRAVLPWVLVAVALVLVAATGVFLLVGGGDDDETADDPGAGPGTSVSEPPGDTGSGDPGPSSTPATSDPVDPSTTPAPVEGEDVARSAEAIAPSTAPPSRDVNGNAVRYDAFNMLDAQDDTAWRTPGDATGATIGFDLAAPTRLTQVGLLNGYAKSDPGYDGYAANRRVLAVEWIFADGSVVAQTLDGDTREVQTIDVDVETTNVQLRIVAVSKPGRGPSGRDFTAISTVALVGVPA